MKHGAATLLASGIGWIVFFIAIFTALGAAVPTIDSTGQEIVS